MPQKPKSKQPNPQNKKSWVQLTSEFVKEWPEVLDGLSYTNMPISYVKYCNIILKNNVTIHYDVEKEIAQKKDQIMVANTLKKFINTNYQNIQTVDLKFDVPKLKADMELKTAQILDKTFSKY
jgi:hypothetical protein